MKYVSYSSGSDGNCALLKCENLNILIDIGISRKQIIENLEIDGLTLADINAILITHEHVDHIKALQVLIKESIPIYMSRGTFYSISKDWKNSNGKEKVYELLIKRQNEGSVILFEKDNLMTYKEFEINGVKILPLPLFHDAAETVGFRIKDSENMIVSITDTGYVHESLFDEIKNASIYVLESNHDPEILMASDRPYGLKLRIVSDHGHLSNVDSMLLLVNLMGNKTKHVLHAHVSQECNLTQIIEFEREKIFKEYNINTENITFDVLAPRRNKEYIL